MEKNLICIVFVMFAGCCPPQEGAQTPAETRPQEEVEQQPPPDDDKPKVDAETRAAFEEAVRRHPPSPMLPSRNQDR
jgi:hypothetical protein